MVLSRSGDNALARAGRDQVLVFLGRPASIRILGILRYVYTLILTGIMLIHESVYHKTFSDRSLKSKSKSARGFCQQP